MAKKHEKGSRGIFLEWGGRYHGFNKASVRLGTDLRFVFVRIECRCGIRPATLAMDPATAKAMAEALIEEIKGIEDGADGLPEPTVSGYGRA